MRVSSVFSLFIVAFIIPQNKCTGDLLPPTFVDHLRSAADLLLKKEVVDTVQDVLMRYVRFFMENNHMPMRTKSGVITVPLTEEIKVNMRKLVLDSLSLETGRNKLIGKEYNFRTIVDAFSFIYDTVITLDKVVEDVNASFTRHKDIEHPAMLDFYHKIKADERMVKKDDLALIVAIIVRTLDEAYLSVEDIENGKVVFDQWEKATADEAVLMANMAGKINMTYAALFHQAATVKTAASLPTGPEDEDVSL